jgi:hypothetical protein
MPYSACFSYPADVPPGAGPRAAARSAPSGPRRMTNTACFSYPADLRRMLGSACFSYPVYCRYDYLADVLTGTGKHDVAEPIPPGLYSMPSGTCFRY